MTIGLSLNVNGSVRRLRLDNRVTLLDALRDELDAPVDPAIEARMTA